MINSARNRLRLCCLLDRPAERVKMTMRCQTLTDFPQDLMLLDNSGESFFAHKDFDQWSFPIKKGDYFGDYFDATNLDWLEDFQLISDDGQCTFDLPMSSIRVFVDGSQFNLPYLVEANDFPPAVHKEKFWVICRECDAGFIKAFTYKVSPLKITKGLPTGWCMFSLESLESLE